MVVLCLRLELGGLAQVAVKRPFGPDGRCVSIFGDARVLRKVKQVWVRADATSLPSWGLSCQLFFAYF
jgi:hypothetical protein